MYIIGDSQVRSFSYLGNVTPLFIGPSRLNNFNTDKLRIITQEKIIRSIKYLDALDQVVIFTGSGYRYSDYFKSHSKRDLSLFCDLFFSAIIYLRKNCSADLAFVGPVPPTAVSGIDFAIWLNLNESLLSYSNRYSFVNYNCCSKLIGQNEPTPLNEYEAFDETHISSTAAFRICENLSENSRGPYWSEHKYVESIRDDELGEVKVMGNITHGDMEISELDTINFHTLHHETSVVELFIREIIDSIDAKYRPSLCIIEESEGFISRAISKHLKDIRIHRVFRNNLKWKKAKKIDKLMDMEFRDFYLSDDELYLNHYDIIIVDGFEKIRDEWKKELLKILTSSKQFFILTKTAKKDSVYFARKLGEKVKQRENSDINKIQSKVMLTNCEHFLSTTKSQKNLWFNGWYLNGNILEKLSKKLKKFILLSKIKKNE